MSMTHSDETREDWQAVGDAALEKQYCLWAIPAAMCLAALFNISGLGHALQRIFLSMPVHELGHAVTAWFCGFSAIPTVWKTLIPESRGFVAPLILAAVIGHQLFRGWQANHMPAVWLCAALLLIQALCTFVMKEDTAQKWITFGGDGMGMVLAVLLIGSFHAGKNTQLYKGSLRWGFLVIGAAAFADIFGTWWRARRDPESIPFGAQDGIESDTVKLVDNWGWSHHELVTRYFTLGLVCLLAIGLVYAWGLWRVNREIATRQQAARREEWERRRKSSSPA